MQLNGNNDFVQKIARKSWNEKAEQMGQLNYQFMII